MERSDVGQTAAGGEPVIDVKDLTVEYGRGARRFRAVDGVSFAVRPGECVGFIGANGAGKSTTMKTIMGFLFPLSGTVRVFGREAGTVEARRRMGYLPEVSQYYPFMKARELLELYGGLHGLGSAALKRRIPPLLEEVGLAGKGEGLLKGFSKGMQQRLGIAQALISDPDLFVFDELSSGLDPVGRHDVRQVLLNLKRRGRTIFFSSHELSEVETLCDRVVIIHKGRVVTDSPVADLMAPLNEFEIEFAPPAGGDGALPEAVRNLGVGPGAVDGNRMVTARGAADYAAAVAALAAAGVTIARTASRSRSLEDHFIQLVRPGGLDAPHGADR